MRNYDKLPARVQPLQDRNYAPSMAPTRRSDLLNAFPSADAASEDVGIDTHSQDPDPRSPTGATAQTASQDSEAEGESLDTSCKNSPASSPKGAISHDCSTWLPTGYFIFPDPLSPGKGVDKISETTEKHATLSSDNEESIVEDKAATELGNSAPLASVSLEENAERDPAPPANEETNQFLPLMKDEPNYPRNPTLNPGLEKINKRLRRVTVGLEGQSTQADRTHPSLGIHPAFRQTESQLSIDNEALEALRAEFKQLKTDVKVLERSTASRNSRQAEAIRRLERNEERIVRGWERMRDELFRLKAMQERLRGRANMQHDIEGRW